MCRKIAFILGWFFLGMVWAHDYVPGEPQKHPILLRGGILHTVSQGVLEGYDLLFENGRITQIGKNLTPPPNAEIIELKGQHVYPGLIAPASVLGLIEIGAVRATDDLKEVGWVTPEVQSHIAYNPDSELIPTVRSNGITTVLVVPQGGLINGRSSLIQLDGWTKEDAMEQENVGLHIAWPRLDVSSDYWEERSEEEQEKEKNKKLQTLRESFEEAKNYSIARQNNPALPIDARWEAMVPVFQKKMPVFIYAETFAQIEMALNFVLEYDLKMILVGGQDSCKLADRLKAQQVPVILKKIHSLPWREDEDYDLQYRLPQLLKEAGVRFCLSFAESGEDSWDGAWNVRNLPFMAGNAVAYGLTTEEALRSITLSTAEILGVADRLGSLDVGKKATLVISQGDLLDPLTHNVVLEFIEGRKVDLDNKHKELYRKYRQKK